jgi:hypothetical protein
VSIFTRVRERFQRRYDIIGRVYAPEPGSGVFRDPRVGNTPLSGGTLAVEDTPTATMPAPAYKPHGIDTPETLAALREKAVADALAAQESAQTAQWGRWDEPVPVVPAAHEPPPMPPAGLSRIMVSQIPAPDPDITNYDRAHGTAEYLRKIGAATGTWTDMEATGFWDLAALTPAAPGVPAGFRGEKTGGGGLPVPAGEFILRFDEDGPGEPFSFTAVPPAPAGPEVAA